MNKSEWKEVLNILNPEVGTQIGNDDFVYGNYIEFEELKYLDLDTIEQLMSIFEINMDFDEDTKEIIFNELRDKGVPDGVTFYEDAGDLDEFPDEYKFFESGEYDKPVLFDDYSLELVNVKNNLNKLFQLAIIETDELVKRSLVFSMFSLSESFWSSKIRKIVLSTLDSSYHHLVTNYFKSSVNDKLKDNRGRNSVGKFFIDHVGENGKYKTIQLPHNQLRNVLAHDIANDDISIIDNEISYIPNKRDDRRRTIMIDKLFDDLNKFIDEMDRLGIKI